MQADPKSIILISAGLTLLFPGEKYQTSLEIIQKTSYKFVIQTNPEKATYFVHRRIFSGLRSQ